MTTQATNDAPPFLIGYTDARCDDPRGQFYNWRTARAMVVDGLGQGRRDVAPTLGRKLNAWTQFVGWMPDGKQAFVYDIWEDEKNYVWEREHRTFRMTEGWLADSCIVDLANGAAKNLTAIERVSIYNTGIFAWPNDPSRLGFTALIGPVSHPFVMDADGRNKRDLTTGEAGFTYGYSASPDGSRVSYHKDYQVYVADADGGNALKIDTGDAFHFGPLWSPDGQWLTFLAGRHGDANPYLVRADGTGARKLAERGGYSGAIEKLDTPDFHSESSDVPVWSSDSKWIYYTAKVGKAVELLRVSLDGKVEQLTHSRPGVQYYHPTVSPDGRWVAVGSTRDGARALYVMRDDGTSVRPITEPTKGRSQAHAYWQPVASK